MHQSVLLIPFGVVALFGSYILTIRVEAMERGGLLKDITTLLTNEKIK